ncbi:MAG: hypothetical protein QM731_09930 [Chitinophagaceae bacterium]
MYKTIFTLVFIISSLMLKAQQNPAEQLAQKIAQKMKDSLSLSTTQQQDLYTINLQLHQQKLTARSQNNGNLNAITVAIQHIENTRDSLYKPVLTAEQFTQYRQKKLNLLNNN